MKRTDNYTIALERARVLFLEWDQEAMIRRAGIEADDQYLTVPLLDRRCRVERATGRAYIGDRLADFDEALTVYDYLCRTDPIPAEGEWVSMGSLRHSGQTRPETDSVYAREAAFLQAHIEVLPDALSRLGGEPFPYGDVGSIVPLVGRVRAAFRFWAGDDEFPPSCAFLWDANAWQKLKFETMYYAMGCFFRRLHSIISENCI